MKYIDADCLKAEIEKNIKEIKDAVKRFTPNIGFFDAKLSGIYDVMAIIDSLQQEQPDVDLEKALNGLDNAYFDLDGIAVMGATYYLTVNDLKDIARDFYELGKNSK